MAKDTKKAKKEELSNWETVPHTKKNISDVLPSVEITGLSFNKIKTKYSGDSQDSNPTKSNIDIQWKKATVVPKTKFSDVIFDGKLKLFDEDGEEVASQG